LYKRRKILLELINVFGGEINRTKFFKLLFLFSQGKPSPFYNFVPYRFGCYSFLAENDLRILKKYGYLDNSDQLKLVSQINFLESSDIYLSELKSLKNEFCNYSNDELISYVYNKYPAYTVNSVVKDSYLVHSAQNQYSSGDSKVLFSIGYEGKDIDLYLNRLIENKVELLCDVRKNPLSMKFGFSKNQLMNYCEKLDIKYMHFPELGIDSSFRKNLNEQADYENLFNHYNNSILPQKNNEIDNLLLSISPFNKIAFTCFEADYKSCHRSHLLNYIYKSKTQDYKITHL
jgi:uncharacterized protein (DUF488 family)